MNTTSLFNLNPLKGVSIICIKVTEKTQYSAEMLELSTFYGVVYYDEEVDKKYYPVYPFVPSKLDKRHLEEFIATYYDELEACYKQNIYGSFLFQKCQFETETKERLKKEWHKKGVIIN